MKEQHPATFAENDIQKLILFFTKEGGRVLDPFLGSGSTLIACLNTRRDGVGVELIDRWVTVAERRIQLTKESCQHAQESGRKLSSESILQVVPGDSRQFLRTLDQESFDFVVTSPPYWRILTKARDHKSKRERLSKGLPTKYSEDERDLGNVSEYRQFLVELAKVFVECYRVLKKGKYMVVIVSDFRHGSKFIAFHNDLATAIVSVGFSLEGITILAQDSKNLYPYGMPYAFVSNIHHQYILIFRKTAKQSVRGNRLESSSPEAIAQ